MSDAGDGERRGPWGERLPGRFTPGGGPSSDGARSDAPPAGASMEGPPRPTPTPQSRPAPRVLWPRTATPQPSAFRASTDQGAAAPVRFVDESGAFFRLVARGAALQLVTFGFYRFWLVTDMRRHLWSRTSLDGEPLEYLGQAKELLVGFLIALAVLAPIYLGYAALGYAAETAQAFASLPFFLLYYLLGHFALYRARRYRLTRTVWRGVRFWMEGSGWAYAGRVALWGIALALTLGLAAPWRAAALERYKMRNTRYGDLAGDFVGAGAQFLRRVWWIYALVAAPFVFLASDAARHWAELASGEASAFGARAALTAPFALGLFVLLLPIYRAMEWRWWADGVRIGGARLASDLPAGALWACYAKFAGAVAAMMAVALMAGGAILATNARGFGEQALTQAFGSLGVAAAIVLLYLVTFLAIGALSRYFLLHHYWRAVAGSLSVIGLEALEGARGSAPAATSLGEGLADQLDVGAF